MRGALMGVMAALLALAVLWSSPPSALLEGTIYQSAAASGCGAGTRPINPPASWPACRLVTAPGSDIVATLVRGGPAHRVRADSGGRYVLDLQVGDYLVSTASPPDVPRLVHLTRPAVYTLDLYLLVPLSSRRLLGGDRSPVARDSSCHKSVVRSSVGLQCASQYRLPVMNAPLK